MGAPTSENSDDDVQDSTSHTALDAGTTLTGDWGDEALKFDKDIRDSSSHHQHRTRRKDKTRNSDEDSDEQTNMVDATDISNTARREKRKRKHKRDHKQNDTWNFTDHRTRTDKTTLHSTYKCSGHLISTNKFKMVHDEGKVEVKTTNLTAICRICGLIKICFPDRTEQYFQVAKATDQYGEVGKTFAKAVTGIVQSTERMNLDNKKLYGDMMRSRNRLAEANHKNALATHKTIELGHERDRIRNERGRNELSYMPAREARNAREHEARISRMETDGRPRSDRPSKPTPWSSGRDAGYDSDKGPRRNRDPRNHGSRRAGAARVHGAHRDRAAERRAFTNACGEHNKRRCYKCRCEREGRGTARDGRD